MRLLALSSPTFPLAMRRLRINGNTTGPMKRNSGRSLSEFQSPSQTIVVGEIHQQHDPRPALGLDAEININNRTMFGHLGTMNFVFADGHVKAMKGAATANSNINMWSVDPIGTAPSATLISWMASEQARLEN